VISIRKPMSLFYSGLTAVVHPNLGGTLPFMVSL
jgi:hypothetical protein